MKVKVFKAQGIDAVDKLEGNINQYLQSHKGEIKNTHLAATTIGDNTPLVVVTIYHL